MCEVTKKCSKCGEEKPLTTEFFTKRKISKDGFRNQCDVCLAEARKRRYWANLEKNREYTRQRYYDNIDWHRQWYQENREERLQYRADYYEANTEACIERSCKYQMERYHNDPLYKIIHDIRKRIYGSLKQCNWSKDSKTQEILGCDWETFQKHIQDQFQEGMTWDNYGFYGWHYDHIIPVSFAKNQEEAIKLNHYTNFQPLWAEDNLKKGDRIGEEWGNVYLTV